MLAATPKDRVDSLIKSFWKDGYLTVSRKFGRYLPKPSRIGQYDVDAVGKYKKKYVIGITLTEEDIKNGEVKEKIAYLSSRNTRYTNSRVSLFVGVPPSKIANVREIISEIPLENRKTIKLIPLDHSRYN